VGTIEAVGSAVTDLKPGDRVTIDPSLSCVTRGITPICASCAQGRYNACLNFGEGNLPAGCGIGANNRTGGSWSEFFVAHRARVYRIPESFSDARALFIEPLCCALHAVTKLDLSGMQDVLVFGAGTLGLMTVAALRMMGFSGRLLVAAKYPFQAQAARMLGADEILPPRGNALYESASRLTGAKMYHGRIANGTTLMGGVDAIFDWVGTSQSITDSLKLLKPGGHLVLGGISRVKDADFSPLWAQECIIHGSASHATETYQGEQLTTFALAIKLMSASQVDFDSLLTHTFPLEQYRAAFRTLMNKERAGAIKVAFEFPEADAKTR